MTTCSAIKYEVKKQYFFNGHMENCRCREILTHAKSEIKYESPIFILSSIIQVENYVIV